MVVVDFYSFEIFVHIIPNEFLKTIIFFLYPLVFVSNGILFFLLKINKALLKLFFIPKLTFY